MSTTVTYKGATLTTVDNQTRTLLTSGKYMEDDITLVDVSQGSANLQTKTATYTPTTSQQTAQITPDAGYDGLDEVDITINAVATGVAGTPQLSISGVTNHYVKVTPTVTNTTGYITGGTKTGLAEIIEASDLVSGTKSITSNGTGIDVTNYAAVDVAVPVPTPTLQTKTNINPTTSSQTITPDTGYDGLASVQVNGDANLVATNIKKNISIFGVTGTYDGGGGGGVVITDTTDSHGGTIREITAVELSLTTKTITANGTYDPQDDNVDGYTSISVNVPQGLVIPAGMAYYNGYLLPQLPVVSGYDYAWIRRNNATGNFDLALGTAQWHSNNGSLDSWALTFNGQSSAGSRQYSIPQNGTTTTATDWGEPTSSTNTYGTSNDRKVIWTSHNIMIGTTANVLCANGIALYPPS